MLGSEAKPLDLNAPAPVPLMLVGLQGSGKTTTAAKIAQAAHRAPEAEGADGLARYAPAGGAGAVEGPRRAGGRSRRCRSSPASRRSISRDARDQRGAARRLRRAHPRHRRPHPYRRAADGRDGRDQGGDQPARDPAGGRLADRPGRGQPRPARSTSGSASPASCSPASTATAAAARRCRCARSPASRSSSSASARSSTRSRTSIRRASPAASSAWATSSAWSRRRRETLDAQKTAKAAERMRKGVFDLKTSPSSWPDAEDGRHVGRDGHAARHRQDEEADRRAGHRRSIFKPADGDHRLDDAAGAPQARTAEGVAARSASRPAPARGWRTSTSSSRCTGRWPT